MTGVRGVVDCGTNSTRLWLRPDPARPPRRREQVTRLGRGVDANGHLDDEALADTMAVVDGYAAEWRRHGVSDREVAIVATSAVRDAADRERFFDGIAGVAGVTPVVLTGEQEAAASFVGATTALAIEGPVLVVDIGGGSTELVLGTAGRADDLRVVSTQLGTVRLTERHLHEDPPTEHEVETARHAAATIVADGLEEIGVALPARASVATVVAVAGTATTLAGMDTGSTRPQSWHGHVLDTGRLDELAASLLALPAARRDELGPLAPGRADVIAAGALILATVAHQAAAPTLTVSVADVMDGVAALWPFELAGSS